ncbi:MAG: iron-containing alcohol dehydrogenase [Patescibacteria group bacterium]
MRTKTAVILAAGTGKRLDAFETPKPVVRLGNKSLVVHTLENLKEAGFRKFYVVVGKNSELVKRELINYSSDVEFTEQKRGSNSMLGSILSLEGVTKESFLVTMCDLVFDKNPYKLLLRGSEGSDLSVLVSDNEKFNSVSGAQVRVLCDNKNILDLGPKIKEFNAMEAGVYFFTTESFQAFVQTSKRNKDLKTVHEVFKKYNQKSSLRPVFFDGEWFDINTPVTLIRAELFLQKKAKQKKQKELSVGEYKKLKKDSVLDYNKKITFEVNIARGIIDELQKHEIIPHKFYYSPHHILIDRNIDKLYGDKIYKKLLSLGYRINKILVEPGEQTKSVENFVRLANEIIEVGIDKKSVILAVGGGVVKDLAGFLASSLYRGVGFISIPTTVLSQCDAAIAFKQGVNGDKGKNLIGSYYTPMKIVIDPNTLLTLGEEYIRDGLAECLKQSFAQDKSFYKFFADYNGDVKDLDFLEEAIRRSVKLKVGSIQQDFNEENVALVNQYGHEVGHAVEYLSAYKLKHGEAVAVGMRVSAEMSNILGIAKPEVLDAHYELFKKYKLPYSIPKYIKPEDIINTLRYNKKFHSGEPRFVLVTKIGSIWNDKRYYTVGCSDDFLKEAIERSYVG